ncbi:MAG TPA: CHAT domain-containing protein, partial [Caldilineaceae bacterium]|nr:CHAT domain-containing protein [Caldilineaceae bacterium]
MTKQIFTPVIFLAFANDRGSGLGYLRNLPEEARQLRDVVEKAAAAGLCEVVIRQNVTTAELLDVFQDARYRDRIALFHFGGHANGYQLLLETVAGQPALADAGGLAAFLGQQTGLELAFLNGCSTQEQAQALLDAGVSVVIATSQAINDAVATDFATRFYQGLASGASIQTAFNEAVAASKTAQGGQTRQLYYVGAEDQPVATAERWPWALYQRPGAERAAQWNLPQAVNDPLFGLPELPAM